MMNHMTNSMLGFKVKFFPSSSLEIINLITTVNFK